MQSASVPFAAGGDRDPLHPWRAGDAWTNRATGMQLQVEQAAADTDGRATIWRVTYAPGAAAPPLHFHPVQHERFTLLSGGMRVMHRDTERGLSAGDVLVIEPGEPHAMWNAFHEPAVVRWETSPALRTERWMGMLLALAAAGRTNPAGVPRFLQLAVLLRAYRDELRLCASAPFVQSLVFVPAAWLGRLGGLRPDRV